MVDFFGELILVIINVVIKEVELVVLIVVSIEIVEDG